MKVVGGLVSEEFNFTLLDYAGCTMSDSDYFFWYDEWDGEAWSGGQWWDIDYSPVDSENDYEFKASESFWFTSMNAPKDEEDKPTEIYTFVNAGAVDANDRVYKLRDSGNLIGNPMPGVLKLSDVTITGYQNNEDLKVVGGLVSEEFNFTYLDYAGCTQSDTDYFFWYDEWDADGESWSGGCWWDIGYSPVVPEENDYDLQPGGAFWLTSMNAPKNEDDKPTEVYYIEFPTLVK